MIPEELRIRSAFILHACSRAVQQFSDQLAATFPNSSLSSQIMLTQTLKRELGMLFRYWATRRIWILLESDEDLAKQLNLLLLRIFTDTFRLPRDGSGLRYAQLSTVGEEAQELGKRISYALEITHQPLLSELQRRISSWRDKVIEVTDDALKLSTEQLIAKVKEETECTPDSNI